MIIITFEPLLRFSIFKRLNSSKFNKDINGMVISWHFGSFRILGRPLIFNIFFFTSHLGYAPVPSGGLVVFFLRPGGCRGHCITFPPKWVIWNIFHLSPFLCIFYACSQELSDLSFTLIIPSCVLQMPKMVVFWLYFHFHWKKADCMW